MISPCVNKEKEYCCTTPQKNLWKLIQVHAESALTATMCCGSDALLSNEVQSYVEKKNLCTAPGFIALRPVLSSDQQIPSNLDQMHPRIFCIFTSEQRRYFQQVLSLLGYWNQNRNLKKKKRKEKRKVSHSLCQRNVTSPWTSVPEQQRRPWVYISAEKIDVQTQLPRCPAAHVDVERSPMRKIYLKFGASSS